MYYLDGRWRCQSLVYFGGPQDSSANVGAGQRLSEFGSPCILTPGRFYVSEPRARLWYITRVCGILLITTFRKSKFIPP